MNHAEPGPGRTSFLILYGSQTGNAQDVAERIAREGKRRHYRPRVMAMDAYPVSNLPKEQAVVCVCSTTGQGEVPSNMKIFWKFLLRKSLPADSLKAVHVAVFGLGDSGYQNYNTVAKKLDRRLAALGSSTVCERGLGDDQHPNGYEAGLDPWLRKLWSELKLLYPLPLGISEPPPEDTSTELDPKYKVTYLSACEAAAQPRHEDVQEEAVAASYAFSQLEAFISGVAVSPSNAEAISRLGMTASTSGTTAATEQARHGLWRPFMAPLTCNSRVTSPDHFQDTRHLEFDLAGSGMRYAPGDLLTMLPQQPPAVLSAFFQRTNLDPDAWVRIEAADTSGNGHCTPMQVRVGALVQGVLDISAASPRRYFFEVLQYFATSELEVDRLEYFATPAGRDDLYTYNQKEGRTVLEVLQDFKSAQLPLECLLQTAPHLKPRQFSIASSIAKHPNSAHILVAVVDYTTPFKRRKQGLCSSWLASLPATKASQPGKGTHSIKASPLSDCAAADGRHTSAAPSDHCDSLANGAATSSGRDEMASKGHAEGRSLVPLWVEKGVLSMPVSHAVPMILLGPGTGVAPFRSFLEERQMAAAAGEAVAPSYLLFGCRGEHADFYYKELWQELLTQGILVEEGLLTAFSRDQKHKVYVQDKLRDHSNTIWQSLLQGATVYVSGSADKMPHAVATAFENIASLHMPLQTSHPKFVQSLQQQKRYFVEAWS